MKHISAFVVAALAGAAMTSTFVSPAEAHAYLADSFPSKKQLVAKPPKEIRLLFTGKADALFSTAKLRGPDGLLLSETTQQAASRQMVLEAPEKLQPGRYHVDYRVLSADGDIVEGRIEFTFDPEGGSS